MKFSHKPVLLDECIEALNIKPDGIYVDCTMGGAGHSSEIAKRLSEKGRLIGIDQDAAAQAAAEERLRPWEDRVIRVKSNFSQLKDIVLDLGFQKVDGILWDLGVSSHQLDEAERGFSYMKDAPLDMRMDRDRDFSAMDVVNTYSKEQLTRILREYGEERFAHRIAENICKQRAEKPILTTFELVDILERSIPKKTREPGSHIGKRTFQAIRIEVNGELSILEQVIKDGADLLNPGGRLAVITFHSLEDRIVKRTLKDLAEDCICDKSLPVCVCGHVGLVDLVSRKAILPSEEEMNENPRARSAKLRVAKRRGE